MDRLDRDWRKFGERNIGKVKSEEVDEEYVEGLRSGTKCACGADMGIEFCEICGEEVTGCLSCHIQAHEREIPIGIAHYSEMYEEAYD